MENNTDIGDNLPYIRKVDNHRTVIDNLMSAAINGKNHTTKKECENPFNFHLSELNRFVTKDKLIHKKYSNSNSFLKNDYEYIESFIFHNSKLVEDNPPVEYDEDKILNVTDYYYEKIKTTLGKDESRSEKYKYYVNNTYNIIDSFYQYELMHPKTQSNPWTDIFVLCAQGYFLMCENKDDLKSLIGNDALSRISGENSTQNNNMGILAKGAIKSNKLTGFIMDERFSLQNIIFDILDNKAQGYDAALSSIIITKELNKESKKYNRKFVGNLLNSMKRSGLIGSSTKGFFCLKSDSDVKRSIKYHQSIVNGVNKTIDALSSRLNKRF